MNNLAQSSVVEAALMQGDLSRLTSDQRLSYFKSVCESVGLNPLTKPFEFITLNGKLTLYAKRDATDQLRKIHGVSITISDRQKIDDIYIVTARGKDAKGREDESTGAVNIHGLKGDSLANAFMKAETKAKRRVTLSLCGLGMLDETEVHDIPEMKPKPVREEDEPLFLDEPEEVRPENYTVTFGKFKGQKLGEIDLYQLNSYVEWLENGSKNSGKPLARDHKDFLTLSKILLSGKDVKNAHV